MFFLLFKLLIAFLSHIYSKIDKNVYIYIYMYSKVILFSNSYFFFSFNDD